MREEETLGVTNDLTVGKKAQRYLASIFGIVFVVVILILAIVFPEPTQFQFLVFKIVLALAASGVAAFIPGFLEVNVNNIIRAGGAIAVFVIIFFFSPADLAVKKPVVNTDAFGKAYPGNVSFEYIVKDVEKTKKTIIVISPACGENLSGAIVESANKQLSGDNITDFLEKLKNNIRDNSNINYSVKTIQDKERYEITCP